MKKVMGMLLLGLVVESVPGFSLADSESNQVLVDKVSNYMSSAVAVSKSRECWANARLGEKVIQLKSDGRTLESITSKVKDAGALDIIVSSYNENMDGYDWASRYFQSCTEKILTDLR
ncbi:hypothetical protein [Pseudomonas citronellolis]|jgi:hypothetical protein|uniref:hypothetical protein n=1 Tax=Pseudomonas citronellolis TaxID=53408 RepID=UPI00389AD925